MPDCPICNRTCESRIGLISHIYWKHYKKYTVALTIIIFILGIGVTVLVAVNTSNINYMWDKYVLDKEADIYLSINSIAMLENQNKIENLSEEEKVDFLNTFVEIGVIPEWHNQKRPLQFNVKDELNDDEWCLFWTFDNANRIVEEEDLPVDLKNKNQKFRDIASTIPSRETLDYLEKNCPKCLAYEIYGINRGNRDVDMINFKVCFPDESYILEISEGIIQDDDHCIRIKKGNIIEKENFLGVVFVKNIKDPLYWDFWDNPIKGVDGKFVSKGKEFEITNDLITRIISGLLPNCHMP
ncbi:MAG: hypothetical protein KAU20_05180 [Nanoarchaeota archaeon]|nr:hypothetical protein [Nanoarchaeota archaeon]